MTKSGVQISKLIEGVQMRQRSPMLSHGRRAFLPACALLSLLGGCVNYPAVGALAESMQKNVTTWPPFLADYAASCNRRLALMGYVSPPDISCQGLDNQAKQIGAAIKVLNDYFGALASVSTDTKFTVAPGLKALGTQAVALGAQSAKVNAVQVLADTLADLFVAHIRQVTTQKLIDQADNAKDVVSGLKDIFDKTYRDNLNRESGEWTQAMQHASAVLKLGTPPGCADDMVWTSVKPEQSTAEQLYFEHFYAAQCTKIVTRQNALTAFDGSADQIVSSLAALKSDTNLKDKDVINALLTQAGALAQQAEAVRQAFTPSTN